VTLGTVGQAVGLFTVTNLDDIVVLALFFARGAGQRGATRAIVTGQYLGFALTVAVAVAAALGATLLPEDAIPYLGLLPLGLGIMAALEARAPGEATEDEPTLGRVPRPLEVAAVTVANGGDNIGVYVPVFANVSASRVAAYTIVFFVLLALWIAAGHYIATRPVIGRALARWGHIALPVVLIGLGLGILIEGGAFGL
jgi:cadmium resistance protein CadD (predicted permease)